MYKKQRLTCRCSGIADYLPLKKSKLLLAVGNQHIFCLAIMVEHHLMIFPSESGFLIASKRSMSRVGMITVYPNTTCLNGSRDLVNFMGISGPDTGAQAI